MLSFIKSHRFRMRESQNFRVPDAWTFLMLNFGITIAQYDETESENFKGYQSFFMRPPLLHPWDIIKSTKYGQCFLLPALGPLHMVFASWFNLEFCRPPHPRRRPRGTLVVICTWSGSSLSREGAGDWGEAWEAAVGEGEGRGSLRPSLRTRSPGS